MRLTERLELLPVLPESAATFEPRAPGLHLSDIVHDLCVTMDPQRFGIRTEAKDDKESTVPKRSADDTDAELEEDLATVPIIFLGMAFEEKLDRCLPGVSYRPPPMQYKGVWMSADRVSFEDVGLFVEEHKLTKMSGAQDVQGPKFAHWFYQLKFYCAGFETTHGRIRACFVNADYRFGKTPATEPAGRMYRVWDIEFSKQELQDNDSMIIRHAQKRGWL
jgi:hypothetical protein